jgi:sortase A
MTDTSTLAKLSPRTEPRPEDTTTVDRPAADAAPPAGARRSLPIGTVVRRGIQVFAVVAIAFVCFALWLSGLAHARSQIGLQRRLRSELSQNSAPVGGAIPTGAPIAMLQIPRIGVTEAVVQGSRSGQLRTGPGHVLGTPLPGQPGNAVVAGRRTLYGGPFGRLGSLRPGDLIHATTGEGNVTYRVTNVTHLGGTDGSFVQNHGDNRLTLFTSDSRWTATGRLVVTAKLVGNPYPPTNTQQALDPEGLGLTGQRDAASYMLVWLELLAAAGLLCAYAASRWSTTRVWLVFAPLLAMMLWLFFESFVRLLPATL